MGRHRAILQSEFPYNISARCINKDWFQLPMDKVWRIFCEELTRTSQDHELRIHSFVLMSNHFHLIASTPKANISRCMHQFMTRTSRRLTSAGNRINETFAGRHFKCVLQHPNYFLNAYKYNYRNPVAAQICERVQDYPYSTLHGLIRASQLKVPLIEDTTFYSDPVGTLRWLNTEPDKEKLKGFQLGTRRQIFISPKNRSDNRPLIKDSDVL